jgi:hypothetical protein
MGLRIQEGIGNRKKKHHLSLCGELALKEAMTLS